MALGGPLATVKTNKKPLSPTDVQLHRTQQLLRSSPEAEDTIPLRGQSW